MKSNSTYVRLLHFGLLSCALFIAGSSFSQILLQTSFEGSNPWAGVSNSQACCSYSVTASTAQAHDGNQSFRAEVRASDPAVSSGYRAELTTPSITDQGDMWYGWSMYFEKNGTGNWNPGCCGHMVQWHPENGNGSASLSLWYTTQGGSCVWDVATNPSGGQGVTHQTTRYDGGPLTPIVANVWHDVVFHCNWTTGLIEFYLNGQLYYRKTGLNYAGGPGQYFKLGMNRWTMNNTWIIYYDNLKIGRNVTYNDVAPATAPPANMPPIADAGSDISINLPIVVATLNGSASDPDGTVQSYSWSKVSGPPSVDIMLPGSPVTAIVGLAEGTYVFRLTVTDDDGATDTDDVTVNVAPLLNQSPTANAGPNISITLPTDHTTLSGTGSDPDGTVASYAWTRVSGPNSYTIVSPSSATTSITDLAQGTYVFRLTVTDNNGATDTDNVTVTVNAAPNQAPHANAGSGVSITLPVNSVTLNGTGTDADGTISSYAWTRVSGPPSFAIANPASATTVINNLEQGTYVFRLTVTDDDGATDADEVTVTVNPAVNLAPVANAGGNISLTLPNNSTTLNGTGNDTDGSIVTYAWSKISGPANFTIVNPSAASTGLTDLEQGVYVFRLRVTDDDGATDTDDVTVTVNASTAPVNVPPTANAGTDIVIALPTTTVTLNGSATDTDGTIVTYSWTRVSGPATFTMANPNSASTVISNLTQTIYVFRLTVTDNAGGTDTDDIRVTVNAAPPPPNLPPFANAGNNITITLPVNSTTLSGTATDPDGTIASYLWTKMSGPASYSIANPSAATTAVTGLEAGIYVFRLTATDDDGATDTDNITVMVNAAPPPPPNQAPTAHAGADVVVNLPANSTTLNGNGSDDTDGNIVSYQWTRISGPPNFLIVNANAAATNLTNLVQGTYVFRLTVTDDDGATDTDNITIIVNTPPVANAGIDIVMTLPTNSTTLNGSNSTDPDGSIVTYTWTRVGGPAQFTLANANGVNTSISNLVQGLYTFRLTITDNNGAATYDQVRITVNAAPPPAPNQAPTARAGNDIVIHMPTNSVELNGSSSSDPDGNIVFREWRQTSGPADATISNAQAALTNVADLVVGVYEFELTVRDDDGATSTATVTVTVKNKNNEELFLTLYPNPASSTIRLKYVEAGMGTYSLTVYDVNNRTLLRETITKDVITYEKEFDISMLKAGVYFLQIIGEDNKRVVRKFVKY